MSFELSPTAQTALASFLVPDVTDIRLEQLLDTMYTNVSSASPEAARLGIVNKGKAEVEITLTDPDKVIGTFNIQTNQPGNRLFIDNRSSTGSMHANVRILGTLSNIVINDTFGRYVAFHDVFLRGSNQLLFWGKGASAVGCNIEIEGDGHAVVIGDDALFSSGIWFRNHNMHTVVDLTTRQAIGAGGVTTVVERHVWLGQNVLLLKCPRVGKGSIVGATSLVNKPIPALVSAAGTPARVLRENISWGREATGMTEAEFKMLGL